MPTCISLSGTSRIITAPTVVLAVEVPTTVYRWTVTWRRTPQPAEQVTHRYARPPHLSTVDSSIDGVKMRTPLSACRHPSQFILRTPDHKSLKGVGRGEAPPFGELHAISQESQFFIDGRIINDEPEIETMRAHTMSLQCARWTRVLRRRLS